VFSITQNTTIQQNLQSKSFLSVKTIFQDNWSSYRSQYGSELREVELEEVSKMLSCKDLNRGYFSYFCINCNDYRFIPFGCNSRLCSCCGKRYTDHWADKIVKTTIKGIDYKHLTFSMPELLW